MASEFQLFVYDYNYSSWSMRAGLALRQTGTPFEEVSVYGGDATALNTLKALSPNGRFPVLKHGEALIWDSLAIGEYLAEQFPNAGLWPTDRAARAYARSVVAEMHSSFGALREALPMNIRASYPGFLKPPAVQRDVARVKQLWQACLDRSPSGGPFLFGSFTLADAFYAPVVMRFTTYDVPLSPALEAYAEAVRTQPHVKDWLQHAPQDPHVSPHYDYAR